MTREDRLIICKACNLRGFDKNKGIVCSLTNEYAMFEVTCPDFIEDSYAARKAEEEKRLEIANEAYSESMGLNRIGITNGIIAGIIFIILALVWIAAGLIFGNRIFIYSFILLIAGIVTMVKGIMKYNAEKRKNELNNQVIDADLE